MQACRQHLGCVDRSAVEHLLGALLAGSTFFGDVGLSGPHEVGNLLPVGLPGRTRFLKTFQSPQKDNGFVICGHALLSQ